jgi:hypothetical protein
MPVRRTRRRILTATVVALGIFVVWWITILRPRADQRFVGTWLLGNLPITFEDSGDGLHRGPLGHFRWWVVDDTLWIDEDPRDFTGKTERLIQRLNGEPSRMNELYRQLTIVDVQSDRIVLRDSSGRDYTLVRP